MFRKNNSLLRTAVLAFAALLSAPAIAAAQPLAAPPIAGGWGVADGAEAEKAARFALAHLPRKHPQLRRIESSEQQVVAGMNYRLVLQLRDRSRWRVTVWRKLDGTMALTETVRLR